ncbi:MAG: hypothetical protein QOJ31_510 [Gaiellales bacterium]|nr:hypothetical protein [Gaiellales bacterium]
MPITVELWTEIVDPKVEARFEGLVLPEEVRTNPRLDVLKWVDPWGDTVFNRAQCGQLLNELEIVADAFDQMQLAELRELATRAVRDVHTYLVFVGD